MPATTSSTPRRAAFEAATSVTVTHSADGSLTPGIDYSVSLRRTKLRIEYLSTQDRSGARASPSPITYRNAFVQPPDPDAPAPGGTYANAPDGIARACPATSPASVPTKSAQPTA